MYYELHSDLIYDILRTIYDILIKNNVYRIPRSLSWTHVSNSALLSTKTWQSTLHW